MIMKNKSQYTTEFINVTTQISQIGQMSFRSTVQATQMILGFLTGESSPLSISTQTIIRWNKEISEMHVNEIFSFSIFRSPIEIARRHNYVPMFMMLI